MIICNILTNALAETAIGTNCTFRDFRDAFQQYRKAAHRTFELFMYR